MVFGLGNVVLNRRVVFALFGALIALVFLGYQTIPEKPDLPPKTAFVKALNTTMKAAGYRYNIEMKTVNAGKEEVYSSIKGEKAAADRIHIWGEILQSPVDFYQLGNTSYKKDDISGEWIMTEDSELNLAEIFLMEINPFYNLGYKELQTVNFVGNVTIEDKSYWHFKAQPVVDNPGREALWRDFTYQVWVDPDSYLIRKALVEAVSKNNAGYKLVLTMEFKDYEGKIEIKPPN